MCGFCIETGVLLDLLEEVKGVEPRAPFLCPVYLQEAADWRAELGSWEVVDHAQGAFVALCRRWSERVAGGYGPPLADVLSAQALESLQAWLAASVVPEGWQWALEVDGSLPEPPPLELARAALDDYIAGWIQPVRPGMADWSHEALRERFLGVSIALDIVTRHAADDQRLILLATCSMRMPSPFDGLDLWLQRRALRACLVRSGVRFLKEHIDELRIEPLMSIFLGGHLAEGELSELRALLRENRQATSGLELDLLEAVEKKAGLSGQHNEVLQ